MAYARDGSNRGSENDKSKIFATRSIYVSLLHDETGREDVNVKNQIIFQEIMFS